MPVFDITQKPILPTFFIAHTDIVQVNRSPGGREIVSFSVPRSGNLQGYAPGRGEW